MAPPKLFKDAVVVLSGTFPGHKHAQVLKYVQDRGGKTDIKVTDSCTHLVSTPKEFESNGTKNKQAAEFPNILVVSLEWLLDSIDQKKRLDETTYLYTKPTTTSNPSNGSSQPTSNAKMTIDISDDEVDTKDTKDMKATKNTYNSKNTKTITNAKNPKDTKVAGKKRARSDSPNTTKVGLGDNHGNEPPSKKIKDGQKAKSASLTVPVDENCPFTTSHRVYITDCTDPYPQGTIMDVTLNQTNVGSNNNKFYRIQLLASMTSNTYITWTRWGRVGLHGQTKQLGSGTLEDAFKEFEAKFKEKSGHKWDKRYDPPKDGKYTFIERDYEESSSDEAENGDDLPGAGSRRSSKQSNDSTTAVECTLPKPVQRLMEMIFNQQYFAQVLDDLDYDAKKLPLGKLSKRTLHSGFEILKSLAEAVGDPSKVAENHGVPYATAIERLTNQYYTMIPHVFGMKRPPLIHHEQAIKKEINLLEALTDMEIAAEIMKDAKSVDANGNTIHPLDRHYSGLGMQEMTPLKHEDTEFKELENYLVKLKGSTHGVAFKVQDIFRIERHGEHERFQKSPFAKVKDSDRRLLWHGSRCTNFGGILSQGLRIAPPEAPVSGYMFGKGVYMADISSKSANYCFPSMSTNIGLLLLCEAELGDPMLELTNAAYNAGEQAKAKGHLTTFGKGMTMPAGWKDAGCVHESLKGVKMPDADRGQQRSPDAFSLLYNEYIAYDIAQIRLRYLFRVEMKNDYGH